MRAKRASSRALPAAGPLLALVAAAVAACGDSDREASTSAASSVSEASATSPPGDADAAALADSTVDAWIRAAGGLEAWRSLRTARHTVTTVWFDEDGSVRRMRPRRVTLRRTEGAEQSRIERPEAEGLYVQVFTGDTAWAALNGRPLPPDHSAAVEAEYVGRDVVYWFGLPYKLRDPGVVMRGRRVETGGVEVEVSFQSGVGAKPGDRYLYVFADEDPYPEEVRYLEEGAENWNRTRWADFRQAGPLTYVGRRTWLTPEGRPTRELRMHDVVIDPPVADSLFLPPHTARPDNAPGSERSGAPETAT